MMMSGTTNLSTSTRVVLRAGEAAKALDVRVIMEPIKQAVDAGQQFVETQHNAQSAREAVAAYRQTH